MMIIMIMYPFVHLSLLLFVLILIKYQCRIRMIVTNFEIKWIYIDEAESLLLQ